MLSDPVTLSLLIAGAAGILIMMLMMQVSTISSSRRMRRRLDRSAGRRNSAIAIASATTLKINHGGGRFAALEPIVNKIIPRPALLRERLKKTGFKITVGQYAAACVAVALATFVVGMMFSKFSLWLIALAAIADGLGLPHFVITRLIKRRAKAFIEDFPEALDLIVRGLKSGLPVPESIRAVGAEFTGPVGVEFRAVADRIKLGRTVEDALMESAKRVDTPEFKFFIISLSVQRETGGNLAETLENLSDILRKRRQMQLKIKAMSSEAKASAGILGSLPFVMFALLYVMNRHYVMELFADNRGLLMVGVGFLFIATGVGVMKKMVSFEI